MKKILFYLLLGTLSTTISCKKAVDKKVENYIIGIMTDGRWYMQEYTEDGTDLTYQFDGYEFQFYENGKVDAIRDNTTLSGTWKGDISNYTITSNFPSAGQPLSKLNNSWKITDSYTNAVYAEANTGTSLNKMLLVKK